MDKIKKAIGYVRVSTEQQSESGIGLAAQRAAIERYADLDGYQLIQIFSDVYTGAGEKSLSERRGVTAALETARRTKCPVIVAEIDRLGRHAESLSDLIDEGLVIDASTGMSVDPAALKSKAAKGQVLVEGIRRTTKEALARKKAEGVKLGNPEIGAHSGKGVAVRQEHAEGYRRALQPAIEEIKRAGAKTLSEIAGELNRRGVVTSRGSSWSADNLRRVMNDMNGKPRSPKAPTCPGRTDDLPSLTTATSPEGKDPGSSSTSEVQKQATAESNPLWGTW